MKTLILTACIISLAGCTSSDPEPNVPSEESIEHFRVLGSATDSNYSGDDPDEFKLDSCYLTKEWGTFGIFRIVKEIEKKVAADVETFCGPDWKYTSTTVWKYELESVEKILGRDVPKRFEAITIGGWEQNVDDYLLMRVMLLDGAYHVVNSGIEIDPATEKVVHADEATILFPSTVSDLRNECQEVLRQRPQTCVSGEKRWPTHSEEEAAAWKLYYDRTSVEKNCEGAMDPVDDPDP